MQPSNFQIKLKSLRKEAGLTLEQLAFKVGTSKSYIWELESGDSTRPSVNVVSQIAKVFGVTVESLIGDKEVTTPDVDQAFFDRYKALSPKLKEKVRKILDVIEND